MQDEQERRDVRCVFYSPPPLVFIAGSHGVKLAEPPSSSSEEMTCGEVEAVGPTGQVGRPGRLDGLPVAPTAPSFLLVCLSRPPLVLSLRIGLS